MATVIGLLVRRTTLYSYGLFNYFLYLFLAMRGGIFFSRPAERDRNELLLARNKYWNLSQSVFDLYHRFFVLQNGLKLHYLTNLAPTVGPSTRQSKTLVIFFHGFPDSSMLWRYVLDSPTLRQDATLVVPDLPGVGGSDSFAHYGPTEVLEAVTEFVVAMREQYLDTSDADIEGECQANKVFIVGHDWGCVLSYRLAAEAPCLADRFILTNGPHVPLAMANKDRILTSSKKMLTTFFRAPTTNYPCLSRAVHAIRPLAFQLLLFGYVAAFQLPNVMVRYLGVGGNYSFITGAHKTEYGRDKSDYEPQHAMAMTMGPGEAECQTTTDNGTPERYGETVLARAREPGAFFLNFTAYYRDGLAFGKWEKSLHTLGAFYNIEVDMENSLTKGSRSKRRRTSSASSTLLSETHASSLKTPATIIWGRKDQACTEPICLDGIGDYLTRDSQVLVLPSTGHWTPIEKASRTTLRAILERLVQKGDLGKNDLVEIVKETYPNAYVSIDM